MLNRTWTRAALPLLLGVAVLLTAVAAGAGNGAGAGEGARMLARENLTLGSATNVNLVTNTARLPLHRATVEGMPVWYVLTEVSDRALARRLGLNFSPKLRNLITPDCPCVQTIRTGRVLGGRVIRRPAGPDFSPDRLLVPGPRFFPPALAAPGAVAMPGYSPFVRIAGTRIVYNAPIVATGSGPFDVINHRDTHDRLFGIDTRRMTVDMGFIRAFSHGQEILYHSFESSSALTAVLDRTTFTPVLGLSPAPDRSGDPRSARSSIMVFVNGKTGRTSPPGQGNVHVIKDGLNAKSFNRRNTDLLAALRAGGDAHNVLDSFPTLRSERLRNLYSPIWDVNIAVWSKAAVASGRNVTQTDANEIRQLAARGLLTSPGGTPLASDRSILNCPVLGFLREAPAAPQAPKPASIP